jgi:hypothetical protein
MVCDWLAGHTQSDAGVRHKIKNQAVEAWFTTGTVV